MMNQASPGISLPELQGQFIELVLQAGQAILRVYNSGQFEIDQKQDGTPVTQADLAANDVIVPALHRLLPNVPVWSEEGPEPEKTPKPWFILVDPVDGTREFLKRSGEFTVNIALIHESEPVLGVVYAPVLGDLCAGQQGVGAFQYDLKGKQSKQLWATKTRGEGERLRVMSSRSHKPVRLTAWLDKQRQPLEVTASGSSIKFCRVAQGRVDAYPRFGPTSQWDTAAGQVIVEAAGGQVLDFQGNRLLYGLERDVLNPGFVVMGERSHWVL